MITPPVTVPPPGGPRWVWSTDRLCFAEYRIYVRRQRWRVIRGSHSGAYWVRYCNWSVLVRIGKRQWALHHYVEREP
jgi:hypothetical protein